MTIEKQQMWETIAQDKEFVISIWNLTPEEASVKIRERGFDISVDDIKEFSALIEEFKPKINENGEFSEEDLEKIAGGKGDHLASFVAGFVGGFFYYCISVFT